MTTENKKTPLSVSLRHKAEEQLSKLHSDEKSIESEADALKLRHELEVYQLELELQNEQLQAALEKSELAAKKYADLYNEIYDFSPVGYFTVDVEGKIRELNLFGANLLGGTRASLINANIKQFITKDTLLAFHDFFLKTFEGESKQTCEVRLTGKEYPSTYLHLEGFASENGLSCLVTAVDVTARNKAENELKDTYQRFQKAMIAGSIAWWEMDCQTGEVVFHENKALMLGYQPEQFSHYSDYTNLLHPDDYESSMQAMRDHLTGALPLYHTEYRIKNADGEYSWFHDLGGISARDRSGKPQKVTGFVIEISLRKSIEQALKESEEKFRSYVENAPYGIFVADKKGNYIHANQSASAITGYEVEELLKKNLLDLTYEEDKSIAALNFISVVESGEAKVEIRFVKKNGEIRHWAVKAVRLDETRFLGFVNDITSQKHTENALSELYEVIEQKVVERTAELMSANKELEAFSYSISHEVRTPLMAIDGFANILLEDYSSSLDDEGKRLLKVIIDNANNMGNLIDDLLSFSRLRWQQIQFSEVTMKSLARSVYEQLTQDKNTSDIEFRLQDIPPATGDEQLLTVVWNNLIMNALKFTSGKPQRIIEIGCKTEANENVYFIKDNGAGFDPAYSDQLFGVFKRLPNAKDFEGTGVGLSIVKHIILSLNGRIWAEGKLGEGATFYFTVGKGVNS